MLTHNWKEDKNIRGSWFALRAGTAKLHSDACKHASQPWSHTKNMVISGGDLSTGWTGWLEGAALNGTRSAEHMLHFLDPPVPVANFTGRYKVDEDPRPTELSQLPKYQEQVRIVEQNRINAEIAMTSGLRKGPQKK